MADTSEQQTQPRDTEALGRVLEANRNLESEVIAYNEEDEFLTEDDDGTDEEERSPEQQMIDSAREFLGMRNTGTEPAGVTQQKTDSFFSKMLRPLISAPLYPIKLVQVLIQLGYEPTPPERRYSFVFRQYLYYYPGIVGYVQNIVRQDGWSALYRGVGVSLCSQFVGITAHSLIHPFVSRMVLNLPLSVAGGTSGDVPDTEPQNVETTRAVLVQASRSLMTGLVTSLSVEMIVRPFNVIVIRTIAQHVGKENIYDSLMSSIQQIYADEGIAGFYSGLAPAILGHAFSCVIYSSMWIFFEMVAINTPYNWMKMFIRGLVAVPLLAYIPRTYAYPFSLLTNVMAVNGTQLQVAKSPAYGGWLDCYRDLRSTGSMYRGSVVIFPRFAYKVPPTN